MLDGEYLEPFCKAERRASSPSPSLPGSGYDSSAGCCLDPDASRGPLHDGETDRSLQLHELRVSCWLDLTRSAARWREPAAACLAGHNYAALASYTPAVYSTPSMYGNLAGFELNSMKVAPYTDCARTCKSPSLQPGS